MEFQGADHLHVMAKLANCEWLGRPGQTDDRLGMQMPDAYMCKSPLVGAVRGMCGEIKLHPIRVVQSYSLRC